MECGSVSITVRRYNSEELMRVDISTSGDQKRRLATRLATRWQKAAVIDDCEGGSWLVRAKLFLMWRILVWIWVSETATGWVGYIEAVAAGLCAATGVAGVARLARGKWTWWIERISGCAVINAIAYAVLAKLRDEGDKWCTINACVLAMDVIIRNGQVWRFDISLFMIVSVSTCGCSLGARYVPWLPTSSALYFALWASDSWHMTMIRALRFGAQIVVATALTLTIVYMSAFCTRNRSYAWHTWYGYYSGALSYSYSSNGATNIAVSP